MHKKSNVDMYSIHAVYYNEQGLPIDCDTDPVTPLSDSIESLSHQLIHIMGAFTKPVLDYDFFNPDVAQGIDNAINLMRSRK